MVFEFAQVCDAGNRPETTMSQSDNECFHTGHVQDNLAQINYPDRVREPCSAPCQ